MHVCHICLSQMEGPGLAEDDNPKYLCKQCKSYLTFASTFIKKVKLSNLKIKEHLHQISEKNRNVPASSDSDVDEAVNLKLDTNSNVKTSKTDKELDLRSKLETNTVEATMNETQYIQAKTVHLKSMIETKSQLHNNSKINDIHNTKENESLQTNAKSDDADIQAETILETKLTTKTKSTQAKTKIENKSMLKTNRKTNGSKLKDTNLQTRSTPGEKPSNDKKVILDDTQLQTSRMSGEKSSNLETESSLKDKPILKLEADTTIRRKGNGYKFVCNICKEKH